MTSEPVTWARYVRHHEVPAYEAIGWRNTGKLAGCHHGEWSELMIYDGETPPEINRAGERSE